MRRSQRLQGKGGHEVWVPGCSWHLDALAGACRRNAGDPGARACDLALAQALRDAPDRARTLLVWEMIGYGGSVRKGRTVISP